MTEEAVGRQSRWLVLAWLLAVTPIACGERVASASLAVGTSPVGTSDSPIASEVTPSAGPSLDGHPLSELLPTAIDGVATTTADMGPSARTSPRVFLKVIARLGQHPPDGEVAVAALPGATVYALRVAGATGIESLLAFIAERGNLATASLPPTVEVGGKQVVSAGTPASAYLYAGREVFFYIESPDASMAADILRQLP